MLSLHPVYEKYQVGDERFTVEYIEREAFILLKFMRRRSRHYGVGVILGPMTALDKRIIKRWGIS